MHVTLLLLALWAEVFWTKSPREWTDAELRQLLAESPWGQTNVYNDTAPVMIYLATAKPIRAAESEMMRRAGIVAAADSTQKEYEEFLAQKQGNVIVVAVKHPNPQYLLVNEEVKKMEEESTLKAGKRKVKMTGHFPPSQSDDMLRLVFPRPQEPAKELNFELYLPGVIGSYRQVIFKLKDMQYQGKPEM